MFILRTLLWLGVLVMLLPPSADGEQPAPRLNLLQAAYETRVLAQDLTGVCDRRPEACAASREALAALARKLETGAGIVTAGISATQMLADPADRGTLKAADLEPAWVLPAAHY